MITVVTEQDRAALLSDLEILVADLKNNGPNFSYTLFRHITKVVDEAKLTRGSYEPWRSVLNARSELAGARHGT
jgi:hypothetical protein